MTAPFVSPIAPGPWTLGAGPGSSAAKVGFWRRLLVWWTAAAVLLTSLTGCGVSDARQMQVARLIQEKRPGIEQLMQTSLRKHEDFAGIREGEWKWSYESGSGDKVLAKYGYYGKQPWWKIIVGGLIGIAVLVVTLGNVYWSPWGIDAGLFLTLEVDLKTRTVSLPGAP
jgi:hypothetical protein